MSALYNFISEEFTFTGSETSRYLRTEEHNSLIYDRERDIFFWNSKSIVGDALTWLTQIKGYSFNEARNILESQPKYSTTVVYTINTEKGKQDIVVYPELVDVFWEKGQFERDYWYDRLLKDSTIDRFRLGFNDGWYTIPIFINGTFRNFQCRMDDPKKIRPWYRGVGPLLFNSDLLGVTDYVIITEGTVDAILLSQVGYPAMSHNTGAGWMENWHKYFTKQKDIVYVSDHDESGLEAAEKVAINLGLDRVRILVFEDCPDKYDSVDYFRDGGTKKGFDELLDNAKPIYFYKELKNGKRTRFQKW